MEVASSRCPEEPWGAKEVGVSFTPVVGSLPLASSLGLQGAQMA